ncbi:ABC transporter permease [Paenibacillus sp. TAF43_2]|uniref:ABC transporter permease n=1 Tax=Paenibacillus sp. TAF43_2 TaxID=3233069 RepID=UPI003F99065A
MGYWYGVLINEWMKKKRRVCWILGIYSLFALTLFITEWFAVDSVASAIPEADWSSGLQAKLSQLMQYIQTIPVDDPVYKQVNNQITIVQHQLELGIQPEPKGAIHWLNTDMSGISIKYFIPLIIIVIGGDMFSGETSSGTMKMLLLSPIGRTQLFLTKLFSLFVMSTVLMLIMNIATFLIGYVHDGNIGFEALYVVLDAIQSPFVMESWEFTILGIILNMLTILTVSSVVLFLSLLLSINSSFSVLASFIFVMIIDSILSMLKSSYPIVNYYPMFHLDMVSHFTGNFAGGTNLTTSILLLLGTGIICTTGGLWRMNKKDFL